MGQFQPKNFPFLRQFDPSGKLQECIQSIADEINATKTQTGANGVGPGQTPNSPHAIAVSAAGGIFQVAITDNQSGVNYFLEYSTTPGFANPRLIPLGPSTSARVNLGNQTLFWRVSAGLPTAPHGSALSSPTYFTDNQGHPLAVRGGGTSIGPPA